MAPKRAAPPTKGDNSGRAAKAAKAAKPAEEAQLPPVEALLSELHQALPGHCVQMLRAMLPHALQTEAQQRHEFEQRILVELTAACTEETSKREGRVQDLGAQILALSGEQEQAKAELAAASAEEAARGAARGAATEAEASAAAAHESAAAALAASRVAGDQASASVAHEVSEKAEFDKKVAELLTPLKQGAFAKKDWRLRQKAIGHLMQLFSSTPAPQSLAAALPVALKDGPEARSPFASRTVEEGESLLKDHSTKLEAAVEVARREASERQDAVLRAEALAQEAAAARDAAQRELVAKENEWLQAAESMRKAGEVVNSLPLQAQSLDAGLAAARASLQQLVVAIDGFRGLTQPPGPAELAPAAAEEAAVAVEPAEVLVAAAEVLAC